MSTLIANADVVCRIDFELKYWPSDDGRSYDEGKAAWLAADPDHRVHDEHPIEGWFGTTPKRSWEQLAVHPAAGQTLDELAVVLAAQGEQVAGIGPDYQLDPALGVDQERGCVMIVREVTQ